MNPPITTIIPAHNSARWLGAAIESCLAQTYDPLTVLVVDDASTDDTVAIARSYAGVRVIKNESNLGAGGARNVGIAAAQTELIAFLDADDLWHPNKLQHQVDALNREPAAGLVLTHVEQFLTPEHADDLRHRYIVPKQAQPGYLPSTLLARKLALQVIGGFSTDWQVAEAIDFFARAYAADVPIVMLSNVLVRRRIHGNNVGIRMKRYRQEYPRLLKAKLDRERRLLREGMSHG